jgi:hypothetical protein
VVDKRDNRRRGIAERLGWEGSLYSGKRGLAVGGERSWEGWAGRRLVDLYGVSHFGVTLNNGMEEQFQSCAIADARPSYCLTPYNFSPANSVKPGRTMISGLTSSL